MLRWMLEETYVRVIGIPGVTFSELDRGVSLFAVSVNGDLV